MATRTRYTLTNLATGGTTTDTVNGDGFGAYARFVERAIPALTGWAHTDTRFEMAIIAPEGWKLTHRPTGESVFVKVEAA